MFAFFVTMVARLAISPVVPLIIEEFEITNTQIGLALTGLWLFYAVTQFPSGVLADRFGEKPIILLAVGGTMVVCVSIALAPVFWVFLLGVIGLGAIAGLHYSVATALLSRTFEDIGTAVGIHNMGAPLAGLIAPVTAAWIGVRYGWRPAVAIAAIVGIPVFVLIFLRVRSTAPRRPDQPMRERFELGSIISFLSRAPIAFTVVLAIITTFVLQGVISFLPTFLIEYRHHSPTLAGLLFAMFFVLMGIMQVGVGAFSDRYGRDLAIAICMLIGGIGFGLLVHGPGLGTVTIAIVFIGIGASYNAALLARFLDAMSVAERGGGFGLVRSIYGVLAATGSFGVGLFADLFGWGISFSILGGFFLFVLVVLSVNWLFNIGY